MNKPYILLVEDHPDDIDLALMAFERCDFQNEILIAHNGKQAYELLISRFEQKKEWPAVIFLDLNMPEFDGFHFLDELIKSNMLKLLPVVVLSSSDEHKDIIKSYTLGANSYLRKPIDFNEFVSMIKQAGLYWLLRNTPPNLTIQGIHVN